MKFRVTRLTVLVESKKLFISTKNDFHTLFWLTNSTITSVVYTSVLLRLRIQEPQHILIQTHMEVEILQQAHSLASINRKENPFTKTTDDTKK